MKSCLIVCALTVLLTACYNPLKKTVRGDGNITTTERQLASFRHIHCAGSYNVQLTQGPVSVIKIETDANIASQIVTEVDGNKLSIRTNDDVNLHPSDKIKLFITTPTLENFELTGSGDVSTTNKFSGGEFLELDISGTGNIHFEVNTPSIKSGISGSGNIFISGETRDSKISIAGSGNYNAENLKSENTKVKIAGSGDARLFADSTLDIDIAGVGNVYYKGSASVTQNVAGSGKIQKLE